MGFFINEMRRLDANGAPVGEMSQADITNEIQALEQELAGLPSVSSATQFTPPQAPGLPGGEILQNPLLQAIQDDVTRRVFANQASRRRTGTGETAVALQSALAPTALNLGLSQQSMQQAQQQANIDNLFRLFGLGANISTGQGTAGIGASSGIAASLQQAGAAQAQDAINRGQAIQQGLGGLAQLGGYALGGGFGSGAPASSLGGGLYGTQFQPTVSNIA